MESDEAYELVRRAYDLLAKASELEDEKIRWSLVTSPVLQVKEYLQLKARRY